MQFLAAGSLEVAGLQGLGRQNDYAVIGKNVR